MSQAVILRQHLARVEQLRQEERSPAVQCAWQVVRRVQVQRFRATYADFLSNGRHAPAAQFFLSELYGQHDYSQRDAQFGRIAGAIERLFPHHVMRLAVQIAQVHALTETMDWAMATAWASSAHAPPLLAAQSTPHRPLAASALAAGYIDAWRTVQRYDDRQRQLEAVLALGEQLTRVVRIAGLQAVLEQGFDAFAAMGNTSAFLTGITDRETHWLATLHHDTPFATAAQRLEVALRAVVPAMD
jgi:hypothetical protein